MLDLDTRRLMIETTSTLNIKRQAELLGLSRSTVYYESHAQDNSELANSINSIYLESGCRYGYRKITKELREINILVNNKKVRRIMKEMNIYGIYPKRWRKTSISDGSQKYPYLLKDLEIKGPNHVWATDITYIALPKGFVYLVAIIDLYSRYIVDYEISNSMEAEFCYQMLRRALAKNKHPEIFNSDQGVQFTSNEFANILKSNNIKISMDGKGRCFDNIIIERFWRTLKVEDVYFQRYQNVREAKESIGEFILWYNLKRVHQSLGYKRPYQIYSGAKI